MDWIEAWFGINPDSGDGSAEWLIVLVGVAVVIAAVPGLRCRATNLLRLPANTPKANRQR
jgi:hypothetical protein